MVFEQKAKIGFYDIDALGNMKLTALLQHINEVSWLHAEELGCGINATFEIGLAFIIQRMGLRILQLPTLNQKISVRTWPGEMTRSAFKRNGEILDVDGNKLVEWESLWVLIDINERKIKRPSAFPLEIPIVGRLGVEVETQKIINTAVETDPSTFYHHTVQFSEMDINYHMNNAIYGNLVANVLADTALPKITEWQEVQFNYINEAKLAEVVTVDCNQMGDKVYVTGGTTDKSVFVAEIKTWELT